MNIDELYALAEKAVSDPWNDMEYTAEASPDIVIAIIDRVRELERALDNAVYLEPKLLRISNIANAHAALNKEST